MDSPVNWVIKGFVDPITRYILILLIGFFGYYFWKVIRIWRITLSFKKIHKKEDLPKFLDECKHTKYLFKEYRRTICFKDRELSEKTSEFASNYFNLTAILTQEKINVSAMGAASGVLVGIGVLGTFIGLTFGLSSVSIDGNDVEELKKGVGNLLKGMNTAFLTSVFGMLFSIIYTFCEKRGLNNLKKKLVVISDRLDEKYYLSALEKQDIATERWYKNLNKIFSSTDDEGRDLTIGNMLRDVKDSCEKQREMFAQVLEEFYEKFSEGFREGALNPLIEKLETLISAIQSPASSMANQIGGSIGEDFKKCILELQEELKTAIADATTNKLEILGNQLDKVSDTLNALPKELSSMNYQSKQILEQITNSTTSQMEKMISQNSAAGEKFVEQQETLNAQSIQIMNAFKNELRTLESTIDSITKMFNDYSRLQDSTIQAATKLDNASEKVDSSVATLKQSQESLTKIYSNSIQETTRIFTQIKETIEHTKKLSEQCVLDFNKLNSSLSNVYKEMNEGVNQYSDTIQSGTREFLETYTKEVNKLTDSLMNSCGELSDTLDDLTNVLRTKN